MSPYSPDENQRKRALDRQGHKGGFWKTVLKEDERLRMKGLDIAAHYHGEDPFLTHMHLFANQPGWLPTTQQAKKICAVDRALQHQNP